MSAVRRIPERIGSIFIIFETFPSHEGNSNSVFGSIFIIFSSLVVIVIVCCIGLVHD